MVGGKTRLAQMPATQFQNGYSHCINKIHKVGGGDLLQSGGGMGGAGHMRAPTEGRKVVNNAWFQCQQDPQGGW